jgi:hypothetical protein
MPWGVPQKPLLPIVRLFNRWRHRRKTSGTMSATPACNGSCDIYGESHCKVEDLNAAISPHLADERMIANLTELPTLSETMTIYLQAAYCETVNASVAVCTVLPAVAVTVTVLVPGRVPGLLGVDGPPPQAPTPTTKVNVAASRPNARKAKGSRLRRIPSASNPPSAGSTRA